MQRRPPQEPPRNVSQKAHAFVRSSVWTGLSFLVAALVGFVMLTEFRAGAVLAGLLGLASYGLMAYGVPGSIGRQKGINNTGMDTSASPDPRVELLVEAHQHAATLSAARHEVPLAIGEVVNRLQGDAHAIISAVSDQPEKLSAVLRFFTYYLPSTADLVIDRVKLAAHAGPERLMEIDQTLTRLTEAFAGFRAAVVAPDLASVDIDISLLDSALDADLEDLKTR